MNSDLNQRGICYLFNKEMGGLRVDFAAQWHPNNPGSFYSPSFPFSVSGRVFPHGHKMATVSPTTTSA